MGVQEVQYGLCVEVQYGLCLGVQYGPCLEVQYGVCLEVQEVQYGLCLGVQEVQYGLCLEVQEGSCHYFLLRCLFWLAISSFAAVSVMNAVDFVDPIARLGDRGKCNRQTLLFGFGTRIGSPYTSTQIRIGTGSGRVRSKFGPRSVHGQAVDHQAEYPVRERQRRNLIDRR